MRGLSRCYLDEIWDVEFTLECVKAWECWDGVNVFCTWDGCAFGGTGGYIVLGLSPYKSHLPEPVDVTEFVIRVFIDVIQLR